VLKHHGYILTWDWVVFNGVFMPLFLCVFLIIIMIAALLFAVVIFIFYIYAFIGLTTSFKRIKNYWNDFFNGVNNDSIR
jgi:hypothetical protein